MYTVLLMFNVSLFNAIHIAIFSSNWFISLSTSFQILPDDITAVSSAMIKLSFLALLSVNHLYIL